MTGKRNSLMDCLNPVMEFYNDAGDLVDWFYTSNKLVFMSLNDVGDEPRLNLFHRFLQWIGWEKRIEILEGEFPMRKLFGEEVVRIEIGYVGSELRRE